MQDRIPNDVFFGASSGAAVQASVSEAVFYAGRERPPAETPLATRAAATPLRFAAVVLLVGWAGILFQASFFQQVVIGAPLFEELAKIGPPLLLVALLRIRTLWIRLPLAWASGAAFGVLEHTITYPGEPFASYVERVLFHALSPGVSMLFYTALEDAADVRARWATTAVPTLFHWANNFMAVVLGFGAIFVSAIPEGAALALSVTLTSAMAAITLAALLAWPRFRDLVRRALAAAIPRIASS